jgi:hypothetical protein
MERERALTRWGTTLCVIGMIGSLAGLCFFVARLLIGSGDLPLAVEVSKAQYLAGPLVSGLLGAIVVRRQPRNAAVWMIVGLAFFQGVSAAAQQYGVLGVVSGGLLGEVSIGWLSNWTWAPTIAMLVTLLVLFPDGRVPGRIWYGPIGLVVVFFGTLAFVSATLPVLDCCPGEPNPFAWAQAFDRVLMMSLGPILPLLINAVYALCIVAVIYRYVKADVVQRAQLKWLVFAGLLVLAGQVFGHSGPWGHPGPWGDAVSQLFFYALPAAIAIAIMRYRLYDIDRIINRTAVYAVVTAGLAAVYFVFVLVAGVISPLGRTSPLVVAISTLLVAALFRPLRDRAQSFIDRRFNRARYDAQRVLEDFGSKIRDAVEIERLEGELRGAVVSTVQPAAISLWLRGNA